MVSNIIQIVLINSIIRSALERTTLNIDVHMSIVPTSRILVSLGDNR